VRRCSVHTAPLDATSGADRRAGVGSAQVQARYGRRRPVRPDRGPDRPAAWRMAPLRPGAHPPAALVGHPGRRRPRLVVESTTTSRSASPCTFGAKDTSRGPCRWRFPSTRWAARPAPPDPVGHPGLFAQLKASSAGPSPLAELGCRRLARRGGAAASRSIAGGSGGVGGVRRGSRSRSTATAAWRRAMAATAAGLISVPGSEPPDQATGWSLARCWKKPRAIPVHLKGIRGRKSDPHDPPFLAPAEASGMVMASFVPPRAIR
jgi:hypothetical protein